MEDDLKLWEKIRNSDSQALKVLHDRYYYQLYHYAQKLYHNQLGFEDAVAECFIKLWTRRSELLIIHSVKSYLFLMLRNGLVDNTRRNKGVVLLDITSLPELPDQESENELDQYSRLYSALEKLPVQRRIILELAVFESCTYAQIAEKLDISLNTVKTQIGRAYRFLKEELDPKSVQLMFILRACNQRKTHTV